MRSGLERWNVTIAPVKSHLSCLYTVDINFHCREKAKFQLSQTSRAMACVSQNSPMFRVGLSSSLKYFVLKSLQVFVHTNSLDWFNLSVRESNPCDPQKRVDHSLTEEGINTDRTILI